MGRPESGDETSDANKYVEHSSSISADTHPEETMSEQQDPQLPPKLTPTDAEPTEETVKPPIQNGVDGQTEDFVSKTASEDHGVYNANGVAENKVDGGEKSIFDIDLSNLPYPPGSTIPRRQEEQKPQVPEPPCSKGPRMTKEFLKKQCAKHKLYQTPHLNDILYLHFNGFSKIENLEEYTGLRCLFLEVNGIEELSGLEYQKELRSLYLSKNLIRRIENLDHMQHLDTLDVSNNMICKIENLDMLPKFTRLVIAHNRLTEVEDLIHVINCPQLSVLDLQHNRIKDPSVVEEVFAKMPSLRVLYNQGNPFIREVRNYRKKVINLCKNLTYLDDRPVFPKDRACAEAFFEGGLDMETKVREEWNAREQQKIIDSCNWLRERRQIIEARRRETELREAAEAKGLPSDNIHVNPGDIDWLYGDQRGDGATSDTDTDETECNDPPVTGLQISVIDELNGASTLGAGDSADASHMKAHSNLFIADVQNHTNSPESHNCRSEADDAQDGFDDKPKLVEFNPETIRESCGSTSGECEKNNSNRDGTEFVPLDKCYRDQLHRDCGTRDRQVPSEDLAEITLSKLEPEELTWMSSKETALRRQEGSDSVFGLSRRPNLSAPQRFMQQLMLVNNSNERGTADDEDSLSTFCLSEHSEKAHGERNEAELTKKECNWVREQDNTLPPRSTSRSPLHRQLVCEIDEVVEKPLNGGINEKLQEFGIETETGSCDDTNDILFPKKCTHYLQDKSVNRCAPTDETDDNLEEFIVLSEGERMNFDMKAPQDETGKPEPRCLHWREDRLANESEDSTLPVDLEHDRCTLLRNNESSKKDTQLKEAMCGAGADSKENVGDTP